MNKKLIEVKDCRGEKTVMEQFIFDATVTVISTSEEAASSLVIRHCIDPYYCITTGEQIAISLHKKGTLNLEAK